MPACALRVALLSVALAAAIRAQTTDLQPQTSATVNEAKQFLREADDLERQRRFAEAIALAERAVAILEPVDGLPLADALRALGELAFAAQDYKRTADAHERELAIRERVTGRDAMYARALADLGNSRRGLNRPAEARELLQQALALQRKLLAPDDLAIAQTMLSLGSLLDALNDRAGAEAILLEGLKIFESRPEASLEREALNNKAILLNNLGLIYYRAGEFERAEPQWTRSLSLRERVSANAAIDANVARQNANLAALYQERGEFDKAEPLYQRVIAIYEAMPGVPQTSLATALNNVAMIRMLRGRYADAEAAYRRALDIRESILGPRSLDAARTLEAIAVFHQVARRPDEAYRAMVRSTEIHEDNLRKILMSGSDQQRQAYMTTLSNSAFVPVQENLDIALSLRAAMLQEQPDASTWAATLVMRRKGRVLDAAATVTERLAARMSSEERQMFDQLAAARTQLAAVVLQSTEAKPGEREAARRALESQIDGLESTLAARSREFAAELRSVDLASIQQQLPARTVLVEYVQYRPFDPKAIGRNNRFGAPRYAAFAVTASGVPRWVELGPAGPIERLIRSFRDAVRGPSPVRGPDATRGLKKAAATSVETLARELGRLLLDPIDAEIAGAERVLLAPDGELSVVPFAALRDASNRFLVERVEVSYLTSGRDLLGLIDRHTSKEAPLIVANPAFDGGPTVDAGGTFKPLPGTAQEADTLSGLIANARLLTGPAATERALKDVKGPRVLHIATHGFFLDIDTPSTDAPPRDPGTASSAPAGSQNASRDALVRSGLALSGANQRKGGSGEDGWLTALEAASLDLRGTQLVVLSACETGLGEVRSGDGVYGLRRALTVAGAETQVMSLWQVSDQATRDLMIAYYTQLAAGAGRAASLRSVQLQFLKSKEWSHPFYWAAFVVAGAWEPLRE